MKVKPIQSGVTMHHKNHLSSGNFAVGIEHSGVTGDDVVLIGPCDSIIRDASRNHVRKRMTPRYMRTAIIAVQDQSKLRSSHLIVRIEFSGITGD